jgi:hypothetical protein
MWTLQQYRIEHPWAVALYNARARCNNPNHEHYPWYGGKGIKCLLTTKEVKLLWIRDKAELLIKPSIDRKDNNEDYTFDNCQFIERDINCGKDKCKSVLQFDLKGNLIKEWASVQEASKGSHISRSGIATVARGERQMAGGFNWKYKYE